MAGIRTTSNFSLKAIDPQRVVGSRGAKPDPLYPEIIKDFLASGKEATQVDDTDRNPLALRQGLNQALKRMEKTDKVLVSLIKEQPEDAKPTLVVLSLRR